MTDVDNHLTELLPSADRARLLAFCEPVGLALAEVLSESRERYLYVGIAQLATSAACLRFHMIGPRLACGLLMTHDRAQADSFHITHEFLSRGVGPRVRQRRPLKARDPSTGVSGRAERAAARRGSAVQRRR